MEGVGDFMVKDTKTEILEAALDLFSKQGFHGTSMQEIAEEVGIHKSSIYNHFAGKDKLLKSLFDSFGPGRIKDKLQSLKRQEKIEQPYQFLQELGQLAPEVISSKKEQKFVKLLLIEHNQQVVQEKIKDQIFSITRGELVKIFEEMMERNLIKQEDPLLLANGFIGPIILLRLEHLMFCKEDKDMKYISKFIQQHIDFFWQNIREK